MSGTVRLARAAAINELAGKLARPLDEIFERQLKPRLERLPTRKQRAPRPKVRPPRSPPNRDDQKSSGAVRLPARATRD